MTVRVLLFARGRELAGADWINLEVPDGATVGELRRALAEARPQLKELVRVAAVAVNREYAADDRLIGTGMEVALLPPVSGG